MPPEDTSDTSGDTEGSHADDGQTEDSREGEMDGLALLDEAGEGLVLVDDAGAEWTVPDESDDWVLLDDTGEEWVLVDDAEETQVTLEEGDDGWALVDEAGETQFALEAESVDADDGEALSRRGAMKLTAGGVVSASLLAGAGASIADNDGGRDRPAADAPPDVEFDYPTALDLPFAHGVASGDPLPTRVILWTRLTYEDPPEQVMVDYEVGTDPQFTEVVTEGTIQTGPGHDWTVKADATGLDPGTTYYYRFSTDDAASIVGRTRTAPVGSVPELRFGVVSCTSYWSGRFNAYGRLADRDSLDLVVHVGDYVYDYPDASEYRRARHDIFDEEYVDFRRWETLDEARRRYALYYSDPDHVRLNQQHPLAIIWDNHELTGSDKLTGEEERQAFWEWTPTRPPKPDGSGDPLPPTDGYVEPEDSQYLYRHLPYGDLADVLLTDQQQWRTPTPATTAETFDEDQTMLGDEQFEWLVERMAASVESGTAWRVLGNQKYIAPFRAANLPGSVPLLDRDSIQSELLYNPAQWDGYPLARERLCETLREREIDHNLFFTGDMHMNWCADVTGDPTRGVYDGATGSGERHSVGVSFAPSSVSRGGADETIRDAISGLFPEDVTERLTTAVTRLTEDEIDATHRHVQFIEWLEHGYGIAHLTEEAATLEYWWTPLMPRTPQQTLGAQLRVPRNDDELRNHAVSVSDPEPTTGSRTDPPAPFPDGLDGF